VPATHRSSTCLPIWSGPDPRVIQRQGKRRTVPVHLTASVTTPRSDGTPTTLASLLARPSPGDDMRVDSIAEYYRYLMPMRKLRCHALRGYLRAPSLPYYSFVHYGQHGYACRQGTSAKSSSYFEPYLRIDLGPGLRAFPLVPCALQSWWTTGQKKRRFYPFSQILLSKTVKV
jgi:hypothetical protein